MQRYKTVTYLMLLIAAALWGISFILTKQIFRTEPHMTVTLLITLRLAIATAVMLPTLALTHRLQPLRRADIKWFLLLALAEPFIYHLCETSSVQYVSGSLASVIVATIPLFVPFGMWIAYRQRISLPMLIGVGLSMIGVAAMLLGGDELDGNLRGLALLAGAIAIAVVYTLLLVKVVDRYDDIVITTYQNLIGLVYFVPLTLATDGSHLAHLHLAPATIGLLLVLGLGCSTLAYAFYNRGIRTLGASQACIFNNTTPIFSLIAAVAIGQEAFSWPKVIGTAIVIAGVIIAQHQPRHPSQTP